MHYIGQGLVANDEKCCLLKWQPIVDVSFSHYKVYMETSHNPTIMLIADGLKDSEFLTGPLRYDTEYTFYVSSVNVSGSESAKSAPIKFKLAQAGATNVTTHVFTEAMYYVDVDPLVIEPKYITRNSRLSFRGDGIMDVKYLFGSELDYVQYERPGTGTLLVGRYVRNGITIIEKSIDIEAILSVDTSSMPFVEVAKHGNTWDFHVSNKDMNGVPYRKTLSLFVDDSFYPTEVRFNNDTTKNYMLIDVVMHELSVYDSALEIVKRKFSKPDHVTGKSVATSLSPIIKDGGLQVGSDASLYVQLNTEGIPLDRSTYVSWKFKSLPVVSAGSIMEWKLGANTIAFDDKSLKINGVYVCDFTGATPDSRFVIVTNPAGNDAKLILDGAVYACEFYSSTPITMLHMSMNNTAAEYIVEDFLMQSSENYFLDSTPPDVVTHINAHAGNREIFIDWKASESPDIDGYNVYVDGRVHNLALVKENNYQITGLETSLEYLITVTAVDKSGNESVSAEALKMMTLTDPKFEVSNLTIDTSEAGVHIQFTSPTYPGVDKIRVYRESLSNLGMQLLKEISHTEKEYLDEPKPSIGKYLYVITTVGLSGIETNGVRIYHNVL